MLQITGVTHISTQNSGMWRNLLLLTCCQAVGQAANMAMFSATALSIVTFYPVRELATLPVTMQHLGVMLSVFPAAMLMQRVGRRHGFRVGSILGMIGASLCALGLYQSNFPLMCLGGLIHGYSVASLQMYRFAAVELAPPAYTARAISWVTTGGVVAGIIGPSMVRLSHDQILPTYLATYLCMIVLHVIVFSIMSFIRFPVLPAAGAKSQTGVPAAAQLPPPRPLWQIAAQPQFIVAVIAGMSAFGLMSLLMSASPLAIVACGHSHAETHMVIFMHMMGMFVPAFFTGHLIDRLGLLNVMMLGIVVFLGGIMAGLSGLSEWHFRIALILNGVGWNFLFVGATTMVTKTYRSNEKGKAQALNDFLVFGTTATASFMAGFLQERLGWEPLNWSSIVLVVIPTLAVGWMWTQRRAYQLA